MGNRSESTPVTSPRNRAGLERLERILEAYAGSGFLSKREWLLASRARLRAEGLGLRHIEDYVRYVESHPEEVRELWRAVRVGHTGWMRHRDQLLALARHLATSGKGERRIWAAGCATGQEVYSLAAVLLAVGIRKFTILGTDLCESALERADSGVYHDVPAGSLAELASVLQHTSDGWRVKPEVRRRCRFQRHNILQAPPIRDADAVVCRNVLVYFTDGAAQRALERIREALRPSGVLVLAPGEMAGLAARFFERVFLEGTTAWRPRGEQAGHATAGVDEASHHPTRHVLAGVYDQTSLGRLREELRALARNSEGKIELNLDAISYICDEAAVVIQQWAADLRSRGRQLSLVATRPGVQRWMARTGLEAWGTNED